jgi:hypothetical protein
MLASPDAGLEAAWAVDTVPFHRPAELLLRLDTPVNPEQVAVSFTDAPPDLRVGQLEPLESKAGGAEYRLRVDVLEPGTYALGALVLERSDGTALTAETPPFMARPLTQAEQAAVRQFAPNAGPLDPPRPWWPWAAAALFAGIALALVLAWLAQNRPLRPAAGDSRPKTCWDLALLRLRELEREAADTPRLFYEGLSGILRDYAAARFDWPIHEWTTPEFRQKQEAVAALGPEAHARWSALLRQCDVVIYAQRRPRPGDIQRSAAWAREAIESSIPGEPKEEAA